MIEEILETAALIAGLVGPVWLLVRWQRNLRPKEWAKHDRRLLAEIRQAQDQAWFELHFGGNHD